MPPLLLSVYRGSNCVPLLRPSSQTRSTRDRYCADRCAVEPTRPWPYAANKHGTLSTETMAGTGAGFVARAPTCLLCTRSAPQESAKLKEHKSGRAGALTSTTVARETRPTTRSRGTTATYGRDAHALRARQICTEYTENIRVYYRKIQIIPLSLLDDRLLHPYQLREIEAAPTRARFSPRPSSPVSPLKIPIPMVANALDQEPSPTVVCI